MTIDLSEFRGWPKIGRLHGQVTVTEKIDGTNAAIVFDDCGNMAVQSRKRFIETRDDNYGFAMWCEKNNEELFGNLGPGYHYGEWWGYRIQRGYGQQHRRFSLFDVHRYVDREFTVPGLGVVPTLRRDDVEFSEAMVRGCLDDLGHYGSFAAPGFDKPEGIIVEFRQVSPRVRFKVTVDDRPKWLVHNLMERMA